MKTIFSAKVRGKVNASSGIIEGVSVITVGPAKGHGVNIDATTLEQVKAKAEEFSGGLKAKLNHCDDPGAICGLLKNFRIVGNQLLADLHLLKTSQHRAFIIEVAQTIPDSFGLSISFSGPREKVNGVEVARCTELYSADIVDMPAANPGGLFKAKATTFDGKTVMEIVQLKHGIQPPAHLIKAFEDFNRRYKAGLIDPDKLSPADQAFVDELEAWMEKNLPCTRGLSSGKTPQTLTHQPSATNFSTMPLPDLEKLCVEIFGTAGVPNRAQFSSDAQYRERIGRLFAGAGLSVPVAGYNEFTRNFYVPGPEKFTGLNRAIRSSRQERLNTFFKNRKP